MSGTETPMFRQYMELKSGHQDALLFFRMGDFYELFFEDAEIAAQACELTLTSRNKKDPNPIPMAGVPHHAAKGYIQTLIRLGHKVAIADQVEDPKQAKGIVRREVVRVVSPGVVMDTEDLAPRENCWLLGLCADGETWGLALLDVSTGDLRVTELSGGEAALEELHRCGASELVLPETLKNHPLWLDSLRDKPVTWLDPESFDSRSAREQLCRRFEVQDLGAFDCEGLGPALGAAGAVLSYATANSQSSLPHLTGIRFYSVSGHMVIDETTRRNLELTRPLHGRGRAGSLLAHLDRSITSMGGRLLKEWLLYPLMDRKQIADRQDCVEHFVREAWLRGETRERLRPVADMERIGSKLAQSTANARDLVALRRSLETLPELMSPLAEVPSLRHLVPENLGGEVASEIAEWLVDEPPASTTDGGLIRSGVDPDLDELVRLAREGKGAIAAIEESEREAAGIPSLKVKYNKVFGYFIEITRANLHKVPEHYIRKQTLTNAERFITPELKEFEEKVLGADERRKVLEYHHFIGLRERLQGRLPLLKELAARIAQVDVFSGLAELATDCRYVRPRMVEESLLEIESGRHPVVERQNLGESFVPNDLRLDERDRRLVILTGPNMSGKSTVMRQVALIAIMAQIGSFVPADSALVGICDRVFTRVGASDDIRSGRSTFMVEMSETANILRHASERSLVLLDEIGRGTSTYDGLSIAWAVAESIATQIGCRGIFATHYHEMVELASTSPGVCNLSVGVSVYGERIIFLRRLEEGGASRSYGIQCARLAGMPRPVIARAKTLLAELERHAHRHPTPQLSLFGKAPDSKEAHEESETTDFLKKALLELDPDSLSPREAHAALYDLVQLVEEER
ncbi:MAG: DNA mismatch repair protein MutS [Myxococcota bacterium]|nr:DNA mismatch repair protein MutS [Myxococcota bacterium]